MKIHYLSQSTLISDSANSVHVCRMCDALGALSHDVTLHALPGLGSEQSVRTYYDLGERVELRRHHFEHPLAGVAAAARNRLSGFGFGSLATILQGRFGLRHELASARPDLVYGRNLEWLWAAASPQVPFVLECHAPPPHAWALRMINDLIRRPAFKGLVVISGPLKKAYLESFPMLNPDRLLVAHDGADVPQLTPGSRNNERFRVGYVGHLYRGRGTAVMLELARRISSADFHFVGGTTTDIQRLHADAPGNATFHGHVPHADIGHYYQNFDLVLAPYQRKVAVHGGTGDTSAFMSPLKLFEYMAWAKPILCSDHSVLREVLEDGETALLLPPDDIDAWEAALRRLMDDRELAADLGARARTVLEQSYTWQGRCHRILDWLGPIEETAPMPEPAQRPAAQ